MCCASSSPRLLLLRVLLGMFLISLQRQLTHRADMLFDVALSLTGAAAGLAALAVLFARVPRIAGWTPWQVVVLLGAFYAVSGLVETFVEPNVSFFAGRIVRGELDDILLQPAPSLILATLAICRPWSLTQVAMGIVIMAAGMTSGGAPLSAPATVACLLLLAAGAVVAWAYRVVLAAVAFWAPGVDPTVLYGGVWQLGRYPVSLYHPIVQRLMTYVVPVAFVSTVPAQALTRGASLGLMVQALGAALGAVLAANLVWRAGLRRYTGATS